MKRKALILLSGGLDSTTTAAMALEDGFELSAISFDYGQKHRVELESVTKVAMFFKIKKHVIIELEPKVFLGSSLTSDLEVPVNNELGSSEIPNTYVPARNILFLSYALAFAESYSIADIFIGANQIDYSGYPDCRPEFIESFERMANLGTKLGQSEKIKIHTPLIDLSKAEIIKKGVLLGVDYSLTHSCYNPDKNGISCGICDSCSYRLKGFEGAQLKDPIKYAK
jgi:7-cyano-7-deazaguanine synthase